MGANADFVAGAEATGGLHLITVTSNEYQLTRYGPEDNLSRADNTFFSLTEGLSLPDGYRPGANDKLVHRYALTPVPSLIPSRPAFSLTVP